MFAGSEHPSKLAVVQHLVSLTRHSRIISARKTGTITQLLGRVSTTLKTTWSSSGMWNWHSESFGLMTEYKCGHPNILRTQHAHRVVWNLTLSILRGRRVKPWKHVWHYIKDTKGSLELNKLSEFKTFQEQWTPPGSVQVDSPSAEKASILIQVQDHIRGKVTIITDSSSSHCLQGAQATSWKNILYILFEIASIWLTAAKCRILVESRS